MRKVGHQVMHIEYCDHSSLSARINPTFILSTFRRAKQTLLQLLVVFMRVHVQINKKPEIIITNRMESPSNADYLA